MRYRIRESYHQVETRVEKRYVVEQKGIFFWTDDIYVYPETGRTKCKTTFETVKGAQNMLDTIIMVREQTIIKTVNAR